MESQDILSQYITIIHILWMYCTQYTILCMILLAVYSIGPESIVCRTIYYEHHFSQMIPPLFSPRPSVLGQTEYYDTVISTGQAKHSKQ